MIEGLIAKAKYYYSKKGVKIGAIVAANILVGIIIFLLTHTASGDVYIEASGRLFYHSNLMENDTIYVPGPLGKTEVEILDGEVFVVSSPCPNKVCVKSGYISRPGETIICLPNKVSITIFKAEGNE